ncbi:GNAT family N-acetyltransferase [Sulfitobacter sp. HNIBRBA3233]|uniref:GNAT family N-acetyltransferase n=1 Tax=Sulfitobacter marinivivus TaxID=3158558 RepID=UPI0032DF51CF
MILPDIILRPADPADAAALTRLVYRSKRSNGYDDAFMAACAEELRIRPGDVLTMRFWLTERAGVPLGCAALRRRDKVTGTVHAFFIDPDHKRMGLGRMLWRRLHREALGMGLARLTLDADPAAVPFYMSLGFNWIADVPSGSVPGRHLPRLARNLP